MNKNINGFELYTQTPNTLSKGYLYTYKIRLEGLNNDEERLIRVYLPSNYEFDNPNKRYPVMYMMDGKNLFDHHTSFVGEWQVDETIEELVSENKKGFIVVGIDSAIDGNHRFLEMLINSNSLREKRLINSQLVQGELLASHVFKTIKPLIDKTFNTLPDKENTAVGGSSMGGLFAFYLGMKYKELVSYSLCFSPAFSLYTRKGFLEELKQVKNLKEECGKFFFWIGNVNLDKELKGATLDAYDELVKLGYDTSKARIVYDSCGDHNEYSWKEYYKLAVNWWKNDNINQ